MRRRVVLPTVDVIDTTWQQSAACRGMDTSLWFPRSEAAEAGEAARAKRICKGCPVRDACLEHALTVPERAGVWGGTTVEERRRLTRNRRDRQRKSVAS